VLPAAGVHRIAPGEDGALQLPPDDTTVTPAAPVLLESAELVAVIVWVPVAEGAVYRPLVEIVPTVVLPPNIPSTAHVTAAFEVPVTAAVNCCVPPVATVAELGLTVTVIPEADPTVMKFVALIHAPL
jgi:hypothetical protein